MLSENSNHILFVPKGLAHGYVSLSDKTTMLYMCSDVYSSEDDNGIKWNTIGIDWPIKNPIISIKNNNLITLSQFRTPF